MASYVLVHGGDRDGSIWDSVAQLLRKQGHLVFCPSMKPIKSTTLQHNIDEICSLFKEYNLNNVILVGHSYGAMVITGVLNRLAENISYLVYIDSVVPKPGQSLFEILADNGFNYKDFGLTPDKPCIEPLFFDENTLKRKQKAYIHCSRGEFSNITKAVYNALQAEKDNWIYFSLATEHGCMLTQPNEVATILSGVQIFL